VTLALKAAFRPPRADDAEAAAVKRPWPWIIAATVVLGLSMLAAVLTPLLHGFGIVLEDDAEYYRLVARNIAATGASTFDGQTLTNGYHPLWAWILVLQDRLFGESALVTQLIEAALVTTALPLIWLRSGLRTALGTVALLALYGRLVAALTPSGMEVALLVATTALLLFTLVERRGEPAVRRGVIVGLALAAAVLARIDAAVFLLPLVAFAPLRRATRVAAIVTAGGVGVLYAGYNIALFGAPVPLSSAVKSLGGLQINHRFLAQLAADWRDNGLLGRYVDTFALMALSPLFLLASRRDSLGRALAGATLVGGLAFTAKVALLSSWQLWPWYCFPTLFGLLAGVFALGPRIEAFAAERFPARAGRMVGVACAALVLAGLTGKAALALRRAPDSLTRFDVVNAEAAQRFAPVLRGQRVAMGDRAGSFAMVYPGGVTQLEGLVNDRVWYQALKTGADLKPILCARGVRFVAGYQRDLGAYREAVVPALRSHLTQFQAPVLRMPASAEVGHYANRSAFDLSRAPREEGDDVFYLWRLECAAAPAPPAGPR
jgi:hypothetical protein